MASSIPSFYRVWFTVIDPILSLFGVFGNLLTPTVILNSYSPFYASPPTTETIFLLDTTAGFLAGLTFLQVVLLRAKPTDVTVWRALQASIVLVDIGMLAGLVRVLSAEGRADWKVWRVQEWTNMGITAAVLIIRAAFLLGVGMRGHRKGKRA